ncbi:MAG: alpha/beta fold hydrolase [Gemmatimonadetes bacterium]|nr:alpha/beta fold hydrolase [Gemmatimonadota bacterium]
MVTPLTHLLIPSRRPAPLPQVPPFIPDPGLYPFRSRWLDSSVGRVHYIDEGEGPPILFLHGNPTWSFLFRNVVVRLRKHFRCIAVDYPGFGLSEHPADYGYTPGEHAEIVSELVRSLDLRGLTIMGHDWGGPIGMKVALDQIARLRALVMSNTWYWPSQVWHMKAFSRVMSSEVFQSMILKRNLFVERILPRGVKHRLEERVMDHYRGPLSTPDSRMGVAILPRQIMDASFWLGEIAHAVPRQLRNIPLLLTWGVQDFAFTPRFMDRFRDDFKHVTVRRLDARHYVPEDAPEEIAEAIEEFLLRPSAAAAA